MIREFSNPLRGTFTKMDEGLFLDMGQSDAYYVPSRESKKSKSKKPPPGIHYALSPYRLEPLPGVIVHCPPGTYVEDKEVYLYGFIVGPPYLKNPRFTTHIVQVKAAGDKDAEFWPDLTTPKYVIAETTPGKFLECITDYVYVPPPPPPPKPKLKPLKYVPPLILHPEGESHARIDARIRRQEELIARRNVEGLGEEYELSGELDTEHLEWLLREQEIEEITGARWFWF